MLKQIKIVLAMTISLLNPEDDCPPWLTVRFPIKNGKVHEVNIFHLVACSPKHPDTASKTVGWAISTRVKLVRSQCSAHSNYQPVFPSIIINTGDTKNFGRLYETFECM